jgi:tetratricopeptide (TPR) repeat protein
MFWPTKLAILYPMPEHFNVAVVAGCGALLLAITVACVVLIRRMPHLAVGWFWFLGVLMPVNGLIAIGELSRADRYTYFPMIGIILMVVWSVPELNRRGAIIVTSAASVAALVALLLVTWKQLGHWKNSAAIFTHTLWVIGPHPTIEMNYGAALSQRGDHRGAIEHYKLSWQLRKNPWLITNIGNELMAEGRVERALVFYRESLAGDPKQPLTWFNMGVACMRLDKWTEAESCYRQAIRLRPDFEPARYNLEFVLEKQSELRNPKARPQTQPTQPS